MDEIKSSRFDKPYRILFHYTTKLVRKIFIASTIEYYNRGIHDQVNGNGIVMQVHYTLE